MALTSNGSKRCAREGNPTLATFVQETEQDLARLKESLDWFKTHQG
jgi:hypothetical protein